MNLDLNLDLKCSEVEYNVAMLKGFWRLLDIETTAWCIQRAAWHSVMLEKVRWNIGLTGVFSTHQIWMKDIVIPMNGCPHSHVPVIKCLNFLKLAHMFTL